MIWSDKCIDFSAGFTHDKKRNTQVPNKLGAWVLTIEECEEILRKRNLL